MSSNVVSVMLAEHGESKSNVLPPANLSNALDLELLHVAASEPLLLVREL